MPIIGMNKVTQEINIPIKARRRMAGNSFDRGANIIVPESWLQSEPIDHVARIVGKPPKTRFAFAEGAFAFAQVEHHAFGRFASLGLAKGQRKKRGADERANKNN